MPLAGVPPQVPLLDAADAKTRIDAGQLTVIDLSPSARYRTGHIQGAHFALRARLTSDVARLPGGRAPILLVSADGALAAFATAELSTATERPVSCLRGGMAAWQAAGLPVESGAGHAVHPMEDAWASPYAAARQEERFAAFKTYLDWEIGLIPQLARDRTARFRTFPPA